MAKPFHFSWHNHLKEELKDPKFRVAFEKEREKLRISYEIVVLRHKAKLSQKQLAKKLKISQSAIARIESGEQNLTIETLMKIGSVFGKKIKVKFV